MKCYRGRMHPRIGTSSTKYTTDKTRTPNAKYNYEPEDLGCFQFLYHLSTLYRRPKTRVPLPTPCTTTSHDNN